MEKLVTGIHHITAIAGDAQKNIDFYKGILGIRLVKKQSTLMHPRCIIFTMVMKLAIGVVSSHSFPMVD